MVSLFGNLLLNSKASFVEVDKFPSLEREKSEGSNSIERANRNTTKLADPNHTREVIFALPGLQIHLKTEHLQSSIVPDLQGKIMIFLLILL